MTARQITGNPGISIRDSILEYRLVCQVLLRHDFYEGIRAALVDKDRAHNGTGDAGGGHVVLHRRTFRSLGDQNSSLTDT